MLRWTLVRSAVKFWIGPTVVETPLTHWPKKNKDCRILSLAKRAIVSFKWTTTWRFRVKQHGRYTSANATFYRNSMAVTMAPVRIWSGCYPSQSDPLCTSHFLIFLGCFSKIDVKWSFCLLAKGASAQMDPIVRSVVEFWIGPCIMATPLTHWPNRNKNCTILSLAERAIVYSKRTTTWRFRVKQHGRYTSANATFYRNSIAVAMVPVRIWSGLYPSNSDPVCTSHLLFLDVSRKSMLNGRFACWQRVRVLRWTLELDPQSNLG